MYDSVISDPCSRTDKHPDATSITKIRSRTTVHDQSCYPPKHHESQHNIFPALCEAACSSIICCRHHNRCLVVPAWYWLIPTTIKLAVLWFSPFCLTHLKRIPSSTVPACFHDSVCDQCCSVCLEKLRNWGGGRILGFSNVSQWAWHVGSCSLKGLQRFDRSSCLSYMCVDHIFHLCTSIIHMHVCMYVCMYVRTYVCMYVRTYVCIYVCMSVCMYVRTYVRTYARTHVFMYVCMCVP